MITINKPKQPKQNEVLPEALCVGILYKFVYEGTKSFALGVPVNNGKAINFVELLNNDGNVGLPEVWKQNLTRDAQFTGKFYIADESVTIEN